MTISCPTCSKEIASDDIHCFSCGTTFPFDTLLRLRNLAKSLASNDTEEGRTCDRFRRRFEVSYTCSKGFRKRHTCDISTGGMFIRTNNPLKPGAQISSRVSFSDGDEAIELVGEVAWRRTEKKLTSAGELPRGMGIKFLNVSPGTQAKLCRILNQEGACIAGWQCTKK